MVSRRKPKKQPLKVYAVMLRRIIQRDYLLEVEATDCSDAIARARDLVYKEDPKRDHDKDEIQDIEADPLNETELAIYREQGPIQGRSRP